MPKDRATPLSPETSQAILDAAWRLISQREHQPDGRFVWTRWWSNGKLRSVSGWNGVMADGRARTWSADGKLLSDVNFVNGVLPGHEFKTGGTPPENTQ